MRHNTLKINDIQSYFTTNGGDVYDKWYRIHTTNGVDKMRQMV